MLRYDSNLNRYINAYTGAIMPLNYRLQPTDRVIINGQELMPMPDAHEFQPMPRQAPLAPINERLRLTPNQINAHALIHRPLTPDSPLSPLPVIRGKK